MTEKGRWYYYSSEHWKRPYGTTTDNTQEKNVHGLLHLQESY